MEPSDSVIAVVCMDNQEGSLTSYLRLYEVGRKRPADDDTDLDDDDGGDDLEEDEEVRGVGQH